MDLQHESQRRLLLFMCLGSLFILTLIGGIVALCVMAATGSTVHHHSVAGDIIFLVLGSYLLFHWLFNVGLMFGCKQSFSRWEPLLVIAQKAACGASVAILASSIQGLPVWLSLLLIVLFGALFGQCEVVALLLPCISIGSYAGGLSWRLGLSEVMGSEHWSHSLLLPLVCLIFTAVFCFSPFGPKHLLTLGTVPLCGSVLFTTGLFGLAPGLGGLNVEGILSSQPLPKDSLAEPRRNLFAVAAFYFLTVASRLAVRRCLAKYSDEEAEDFTRSGKMSESLLSKSGAAEGGQGLISNAKREGEEGDVESTSRFHRICQGIQQGDEDLSWLEPDERAIVEVCRKDEFQAGRVMWGGGLI